MADFKEDFPTEQVEMSCTWNGFKQAEEVTDLFPTGSKSNRYFQAVCPDCMSKQIFQILDDNLYVIQAKHQC